MEMVSDRPVLDPGEIVCSPDGDFAFRVIEHIGEGRCCLVYLAKSIRDGTKVALKVYKRGPTYDGAIQREQYILDCLSDPKNNLVMCYGTFVFNGLNIQVMEMLEYNIRQLIYRNERQGLSPWITQKFAKDLLIALSALHENAFAHADLKPANIMWSCYDGAFKLLDFGLTFHNDEPDLHQIQSSGYKAPEAAEWNKFKEEEKRSRKRKLQGTYSDLTQAAPAYIDGLHELEKSSSTTTATVSTGTTTVATGSCTISNRRQRTSGPPRNRLSCAIPDQDVYVRCRKNLPEPEPEKAADHECDESSTCCKWPSESSGIFTASSQCHTPITTNNSCIQATPPTSRRSNLDDLLNTASTTSFATEDNSSLYSSTNSCSSSSKRSCDDASQEWRRGRALKKRETETRRCPRPLSTCPEDKQRRRPPSPNEKVDIWSFGCLLVEAISGRKMFSASDKMASVLRPLQLLEMRIGETEIKYHDASKQKFFADAKDLIQKCLTESPVDRISAKTALKHRFFTEHDLVPSVKDMVLLPSNVLQLLNVLDDPKYKNDDEVKEVLKEVREEASKYGAITDVKSKNGHAYIEFQEASDCQRACSGLTGRTFDEKTVIAVFYPIQLWANNVFSV